MGYQNGNDNSAFEKNLGQQKSAQQRTSTVKKVEDSSSKCQYERLSKTGPLSSGKDE
jgi:hypothetical protein